VTTTEQGTTIIHEQNENRQHDFSDVLVFAFLQPTSSSAAKLETPEDENPSLLLNNKSRNTKVQKLPQ
jgi:hypothetical protein